MPLDMAVSADGTRLYVAAFGSSKIGVFDTAALEDGTFVPDASKHIAVSGGGPAGRIGRGFLVARGGAEDFLVQQAAAAVVAKEHAFRRGHGKWRRMIAAGAIRGKRGLTADRLMHRLPATCRRC